MNCYPELDFGTPDDHILIMLTETAKHLRAPDVPAMVFLKK